MAKASKQKKEKKEVFFVGVKEPVEMRRNILEASREMVLLLQMYEKFKTVREEKRRNIDKLRGMIREIALLASRLKKHLPKTDLRAMPIQEIVRKPKKVEYKTEESVREVKKEERVLSKELTEIEKLEAELASIEMKLNNLA